MRALVLGLGALALSAGCGDNLKPGIFVETTVAKSEVVAGERIDARCDILDDIGMPLLDARGEPLANTTEFVIDYRHPDSFATDDDGLVIAKKAGPAEVRCSAPVLEIVDEEPAQITIVAGAAVRVITQLESDTSIAGEAVGVSCIAFDAFNNEVLVVQPQAIAVSPFGAGIATTTDSVAANFVGEYEVTCVVDGATDVEADFLTVLPALPASLAGSLVPERTVYTVDEQVTLIAEAFDVFGNRVDAVDLAYDSSPAVPSPSEARFEFAQDGTFTLSATVTSATHLDIPLSVSLPVIVNSAGPAIECMRIDAPSQASEAYMIQSGPSTVAVPVRVTDAFAVQSVTINGVTATFDAGSGNFRAPLPIAFGMNFFDVVATDQFGEENSTTCFVLAGEFYTGEAIQMGGALGMRLDPVAIGDASTSGAINSLNDILFTVLNSPELRTLVDGGLTSANPINDGSCGVFACNPDVNYNAGTVNWNTPSSTLSLINGGLQANITLPNVRLSVRACGTTCCIGGSTIAVTASSISATVNFSLALQGGVLRAGLIGTPAVTVGSVSLNGSGFCGFVINLIQGFFTTTVRNAVRDALSSFITSDVVPLLDQLVSSLDINTIGTSFAVPKLDGSGNINLGFGLSFSSLSITPTRALLGIGTRFTPGAVGQNRPSLGIARRTSNPLFDPPGSTGVGISFYEGVLNQVLHGLWRGGFFQATLALGGGNATIDGRLPPVVRITNGNTAQLMLGGIGATISIPGVINNPIPIIFGGRASAGVTLVGDELRFGSITLTELFVSFQTPLTQNQRNAMEGFLTQVLQSVLADAINDGLPAFPIPTFAIPASASQFGLPAGAELGITNPILSTPNPPTTHFQLRGGFGVRP
jgi:hypothetical protein